MRYSTLSEVILVDRMLKLLFSEFYKGKYEDSSYELYIIKDADGSVMYIGISRDSIWHRWFGGGTSHLDTDANGKIYGRSYIGEVIERRLPNSWNWTIELWTKVDCVNTLREVNEGLSNKDVEKLPIELLESYMILALEPMYNVMHNDGRHDDPLISKKMDDLYKRLFG